MRIFNLIVRYSFVIVLFGAIASGATTLPNESVDPSECPGTAVLHDPSFASRTIDFASRLAVFGLRPAAGQGEARARKAVATELETIGLDVAIEPFDYQTFSLKKSSLQLGGLLVKPVIIGFDPFGNQFDFEGKAIVVTDPSQASSALKGRIVVTDHPLMQLMIAQFEPVVVICVGTDDLEKFVDGDNLEVSLDIIGGLVILQSSNVVARLGSHAHSGPEILVTSHIDAYQDSPGANDNGTGLGLMIELARAFCKPNAGLTVPVTFVAFGAEENGAIGSRAYIQSHLGELADIVAVVNLDTLGGAQGPVITTTPSDEFAPSETPKNRIPATLRNRAWEGPEGSWRIIHPEIIPTAFTSNYPPWLQRVVTDAAAELNIEIEHKDLISDHRTFALAGVPAIGIQSQEHQIHSTGDTAEVLVAETITAGANLAAEIVCRLQSANGSTKH